MLAPSDAAGEPASRVAGNLRVGTPRQMAGASTRSHLADGRVVGWFGSPGVVIDAELAGQRVPTALAARFGVDDFWGRWTRAECAAKRADVPIAIWLKRRGLDVVQGAVETIEMGGIVVSIARPDPSPVT